MRALIVTQLARGRYLGFALVFLTLATVLIVPFAIKYHGLVGDLLWPLLISQTLVLIAIVIAITSSSKPATATA